MVSDSKLVRESKDSVNELLHFQTLWQAGVKERIIIMNNFALKELRTKLANDNVFSSN